jgi:hypothetical protein
MINGATYLLAAAQEWTEELEIVYGILRELVAIAPEHSPEAWALLAESASFMGCDEEARVARYNATVLASRRATPNDL